MKDGKKRIYLQVNSGASNEALQKWLKKNTSHGNLAFGGINVSEPEDKMKGVKKQAKYNLG